MQLHSTAGVTIFLCYISQEGCSTACKRIWYLNTHFDQMHNWGIIIQTANLYVWRCNIVLAAIFGKERGSSSVAARGCDASPESHQLSLFSPQVHDLRLNENKLKAVLFTSMFRFTNLTDLNLTKNEISYIEDGAFAGQANLQVCSQEHKSICFVFVYL